ncbi:hypothetical protein FACS1894110_01160 [Spirochaetia bacterium]|nr:hypothetical protein FACS1894110_01160 [Spirochaetia bacterium]
MDETEVNIEAVADWLLNAEPISKLTGEEFRKSSINLITQVETYFKSVGGSVERQEIGTIELGRSGIKSSIAHGIGRNKAIAFKAVPEIIKKGKIVDHQTNWKNRGYDTYVINAPIQIGNEEYIGEVIVNHYEANENGYYLHEVEIKSKLRDAFKTGLDTSASEGASTLIIAQKLKEVKRNSKQALRREMKARLASLPPEQFHVEGLKAAALVQTLPVWSQYTNILLFLSMKNEIDTQPLLEAAFAAGKKLFVPRVEGDNLAFCRIHSPDGPWLTGRYGIREPMGRANNDGAGLSSTDFPALVIVPALAFDRSGKRLGRGGAYYDRFLAALNAAGQEYAALGLCMAAQILPDVPAEEFDKKIKKICTAVEFIDCL